MKCIFLFLLLLPLTSAIAITPTTLNYGYINGTETRELLVVNNLEQYANYTISSDTFRITTEPSSIFLEPNEQQVFKVTIDSKEVTNKKLNLIIDEIQEQSSIINSIRIPVKFTTKEKVMIKVHHKIKFNNTKPTLNQTKEKIKTEIKKEPIQKEKLAFYILGSIIIILFILTIIKKKV